MSSVQSSFPPRVTLASALNSTNASVLAAKAFADPNSGYPNGLRLGAALADNQAGHFNLASGITVASNALDTAFNTLKDFQSSLTDIYSTVSRLRDPAISDQTRAQEQQDLNNQIDDLREKLQKTQVGDYNFLSNANSDGVQLDLNSGALSNIGKTADLNGGGNDQRLAYSPNSISLQTPDLDQALDDLSRLTLQTTPFTDDSLNGSNSLETVASFSKVIKQATDTLKAFQADLNSTALDRLNGSYSGSDDNVNNGSDAQQIASRLAQALHSDSFNVSSSATAHFFSLFA